MIIISSKFDKNRTKFFESISEIWPPNIFKGLTQNSVPKLKVEMRFYVDSENFIKNIETLLSFIVLSEISFTNIAN